MSTERTPHTDPRVERAHHYLETYKGLNDIVCEMARDVISIFEQKETRERDFDRVLYLAEHLWQMIPQEVWREHGAEWMGQYEGDYHAQKVRDELADFRASVVPNPAKRQT